MMSAKPSARGSFRYSTRSRTSKVKGEKEDDTPLFDHITPKKRRKMKRKVPKSENKEKKSEKKIKTVASPSTVKKALEENNLLSEDALNNSKVLFLRKVLRELGHVPHGKKSDLIEAFKVLAKDSGVILREKSNPVPIENKEKETINAPAFPKSPKPIEIKSSQKPIKTPKISENVTKAIPLEEKKATPISIAMAPVKSIEPVTPSKDIIQPNENATGPGTGRGRKPKASFMVEQVPLDVLRKAAKTRIVSSSGEDIDVYLWDGVNVDSMKVSDLSKLCTILHVPYNGVKPTISKNVKDRIDEVISFVSTLFASSPFIQSELKLRSKEQISKKNAAIPISKETETPNEDIVDLQKITPVKNLIAKPSASPSIFERPILPSSSRNNTTSVAKPAVAPKQTAKPLIVNKATETDTSNLVSKQSQPVTEASRVSPKKKSSIGLKLNNEAKFDLLVATAPERLKRQQKTIENDTSSLNNEFDDQSFHSREMRILVEESESMDVDSIEDKQQTKAKELESILKLVRQVKENTGFTDEDIKKYRAIVARKVTETVN